MTVMKNTKIYAYYFPNWHPDPLMQLKKRKSKTEIYAVYGDVVCVLIFE